MKDPARILVVDDTAHNVKLLADVLGARGYAVSTASSGKEALDNPDLLMPPASVAASYWQLYQQPRSAWTFELEIRPFGEKW